MLQKSFIGVLLGTLMVEGLMTRKNLYVILWIFRFFDDRHDFFMIFHDFSWFSWFYWFFFLIFFTFSDKVYVIFFDWFTPRLWCLVQGHNQLKSLFFLHTLIPTKIKYFLSLWDIQRIWLFKWSFRSKGWHRDPSIWE